jgi:hypothetical protein
MIGNECPNGLHKAADVGDITIVNMPMAADAAAAATGINNLAEHLLSTSKAVISPLLGDVQPSVAGFGDSVPNTTPNVATQRLMVRRPSLESSAVDIPR